MANPRSGAEPLPSSSYNATMDTVYLETTVVGHIAGRQHADPFVAARQQVSRDWWRNEAKHFAVIISQVVLDECGAGDPTAAAERLEVVDGLDLLESSDDVDALADALIRGKAIPPSEPRDAFHIAIAAVNGVKYLLTWNFKHIANAALRGRIEKICRDAGFAPPTICTPDELTGADENA
jgi:predicted nucleic acid-binding protein